MHPTPYQKKYKEKRGKHNGPSTGQFYNEYIHFYRTALKTGKTPRDSAFFGKLPVGVTPLKPNPYDPNKAFCDAKQIAATIISIAHHQNDIRHAAKGSLCAHAKS